MSSNVSAASWFVTAVVVTVLGGTVVEADALVDGPSAGPVDEGLDAVVVVPASEPLHAAAAADTAIATATAARIRRTCMGRAPYRRV
jgi:hypothetical protein